MKILVDENIPFPTVQALREMGHEIFDVRGTAEEGVPDALLWEIAQSEGCLVITTDKGFANRRNDPHYGIIIVRLRQPNLKKIHQRIIKAITQFNADDWPGLLVVMRDVAQSTWRSRTNTSDRNDVT